MAVIFSNDTVGEFRPCWGVEVTGGHVVVDGPVSKRLQKEVSEAIVQKGIQDGRFELGLVTGGSGDYPPVYAWRLRPVEGRLASPEME